MNKLSSSFNFPSGHINALPEYQRHDAARFILNSFGDNVSVQNPHSTDITDRINLSPEQWRATYDKEYRRSNPAAAAGHAYYHPFQSDRTLGFGLGKNLRSLYDKGMGTVAPYLNQGPAMGGLVSLIPGAVAGILGTGASNLISGEDTSKNMLRNALIGALVTGGIGAFSGHLRKNKPQYPSNYVPAQHYDEPQERAYKEHIKNQVRALLSAKDELTKNSFIKKASNAQAEIMHMLQNAPGLSFSERSQLTAGVSKLSSFDLEALADSLSGLGGAAIGAFVAKFLMQRGLIGTVLGAIFGGVVSKAIFGKSTPTNSLGQPSLQNMSYTGHIY
jgi:hypothetical protein